MRRSSLLSKVGPVMSILLMCLCANVFAGACRTGSSKKTKSVIIIIITEKSSSCTLYRLANLVCCVLFKLLGCVFRAPASMVMVFRSVLLSGLNNCGGVARLVFVLVWKAEVSLRPVKFAVHVFLDVAEVLRPIPAKMRVLVEKAAQAAFELVKTALLEVCDRAVGEVKALWVAVKDGLVSIFQAALDDLQRMLQGLENFVIDQVLGFVSMVKPQLVSLVSEASRSATDAFMEILERTLAGYKFSLEVWHAAFGEHKALLRRLSSVAGDYLIDSVSQALRFHLPREIQRLVVRIIYRVLKAAFKAQTQLVSMVSNITKAAAAGFMELVERAADDLVNRALQIVMG